MLQEMFKKDVGDELNLCYKKLSEDLEITKAIVARVWPPPGQDVEANPEHQSACRKQRRRSESVLIFGPLKNSLESGVTM